MNLSGDHTPQVNSKLLKGRNFKKKGATIGIVAPANFTVLEKIREGHDQIYKTPPHI